MLPRYEQETPKAIKIVVEIYYRVQRFGHHKYVSILVDLHKRRMTLVQQANVLLLALEIDDDLIGILWRWSAIYAAALGNRGQ